MIYLILQSNLIEVINHKVLSNWFYWNFPLSGLQKAINQSRPVWLFNWIHSKIPNSPFWWNLTCPNVRDTKIIFLSVWFLLCRNLFYALSSGAELERALFFLDVEVLNSRNCNLNSRNCNLNSWNCNFSFSSIMSFLLTQNIGVDLDEFRKVSSWVTAQVSNCFFLLIAAWPA